jgi:hypothetical protein
MTNYISNVNPSDNLKELLRAQNAAGQTSAVFNGSEPFEVLVAKVLFNVANAVIESS